MATSDAAGSLRLRKVINARIARGSTSAAALKAEVEKCQTPEAKFKLMQEMQERVFVGPAHGQPKASSQEFKPSIATQVESLEVRSLTVRCIVKSFKDSSVALRRTLAVYSHLRETNTESQAPIPRLMQLVKLGPGGRARAR